MFNYNYNITQLLSTSRHQISRTCTQALDIARPLWGRNPKSSEKRLLRRDFWRKECRGTRVKTSLPGIFYLQEDHDDDEVERNSEEVHDCCSCWKKQPNIELLMFSSNIMHCNVTFHLYSALDYPTLSYTTHPTLLYFAIPYFLLP